MVASLPPCLHHSYPPQCRYNLQGFSFSNLAFVFSDVQCSHHRQSLSSFFLPSQPCCFLQVYFCPVLHGLLNISLAPIFGAFLIFGPLLVGFYFFMMMVERNGFTCSRFMEIRHIIVLSLLHVTWNLFCRFFFIVHADKGLVVRAPTHPPV